MIDHDKVLRDAGISEAEIQKLFNTFQEASKITGIPVKRLLFETICRAADESKGKKKPGQHAKPAPLVLGSYKGKKLSK